MCPPRYFTVADETNVWMDPDQPVDTERAMEQWVALKDTYVCLGHTVQLIEPLPGLPDMVFTANSGTVVDGRVMGARFRFPQRAPEADFFRRWFIANGYTSVVMPEHTNEGEGDFVWTGSVLLAGTGFRTDPRAHRETHEALGVPVVPLQLVDPRYYHLDAALFVLADDLVAYYPDAFSPRSRHTLRQLFPDAVIAAPQDAVCLGLNALSDGRHVVLPEEATELARQVTRRGFQPVPVAISELRKSGGGPKCCTLELRA
jgi:N-dimethylarginine dimethylaminohydrolase